MSLQLKICSVSFVRLSPVGEMPFSHQFSIPVNSSVLLSPGTHKVLHPQISSQPAEIPPPPFLCLFSVVYIGIYNLFFSALCSFSGCSSHLVDLRPGCVAQNKQFLL